MQPYSGTLEGSAATRSEPWAKLLCGAVAASKSKLQLASKTTYGAEHFKNLSTVKGRAHSLADVSPLAPRGGLLMNSIEMCPSLVLIHFPQQTF